MSILYRLFVLLLACCSSTSVVSAPAGSLDGTNDDDKYQVFAQKLELRFDTNPDGTEMTLGEKQAIADDYVREFNRRADEAANSTDGFRLTSLIVKPADACSNGTSAASSGSDDDGSDGRRLRSQTFPVYASSLSVGVCVNCFSSSNQFLNDRAFSRQDRIHRIKRFLSAGDEDVDNVDILASVNANVTVENYKDLYMQDKKKLERFSQSASALRTKLSARRSKLRDLVSSGASKKVIQEHRASMRKAWASWRDAEKQRTKMKKSIESRREKLRQARNDAAAIAARASDVFSGCKLTSEDMSALHIAMKQAEMENHKMHSDSDNIN